MKAEELAIIKERAEKATRGPWFQTEKNFIDNGDSENDTYYLVIAHFESDVDFIANARQDVPDLAAEVERLQAKISECESLLSEAHEVLDDVHCYETETYEAITKYLYGEDDE